jgi:AAA+ ATPase superfamily predicted ATPase
MQKALEFFSIFGGVEWGNIDTTQEPFELVEKLILDDYSYIRNDISDMTTGMPLYHSILSGAALGDARIHSALKKANVTEEVGLKALDELCELGVIKLQKSKISSKIIFNAPFIRFWFAFVSPLFKGIRDGNYDEVKQRFQNKFSDFVNQTFIQLSGELLKAEFRDDVIFSLKSYWDNGVEIDIYAKTKSKKTIVGSCRYSNAKIKKSELTKLQTKASEAKLDADIFVIVSKNGFSKELKALKGDNLKLYTLKNFKRLVEDER